MCWLASVCLLLGALSPALSQRTGERIHIIKLLFVWRAYLLMIFMCVESKKGCPFHTPPPFSPVPVEPPNLAGSNFTYILRDPSNTSVECLHASFKLNFRIIYVSIDNGTSRIRVRLLFGDNEL